MNWFDFLMIWLIPGGTLAGLWLLKPSTRNEGLLSGVIAVTLCMIFGPFIWALYFLEGAE